MTGIIVKTSNLDMQKDTGMAMVLIALAVFLFTGSITWVWLGLILLLINMTFPKFYFLPSLLWFSLSNLLGFISSKLILSLVFFLVVTPIGMIRRLLAYSKRNSANNSFDSMRVYSWRNSTQSNFKIKEKQYTSKDLENPF